MSVEVQKDRVQLNKVTHSVRASQSVLQYGVGAMVDFPDQTLMTAAPEYWQERVQQIHDERLERALNVDYLGMPGSKDEPQFKEGIAYARFPEWYFCPKCRTFQPLSEWIKDYRRKAPQQAEKDPYMVKHMRCQSCRQDLVVARIITVCEDGHIDDFPWVKWAHCRNGGGARPVCGHPRITFKTGASATEGLEGLEVSCTACNCRATLRNAFDPGIFAELDKDYPGVYDFSCTGRHPWKNSKESCHKYPRAMQRGSSSVYFPVTASSLVIPPYSSMITAKVEGSRAFERCKDTISGLLQMPGLDDNTKQILKLGQINIHVPQIALEVGVNEEQVRAILTRRWLSESQEECSTLSVKYRAEEYEALSGQIKIASTNDGDFVREETDICEYDIPGVKAISLIHKIREVQVLKGFTRIKPIERTEVGEMSPAIVPIKEPTTNWYPAYQVRGEGIFIEFDQDAIDGWALKPEIIQRVKLLNDNYKKSYLGKNSERKVTAKFLLLHTLSHLLIKQLSFECGYSISSLKERIYCSEEFDGKRMGGILIYTASGDSEGTLGGLVRQGRADTFPKVFNRAIEAALICSNDPVCRLSSGQGRDSLNLAACYSCALLPETCCEEFNIFLDRDVVIGTFEKPELGFYSGYDTTQIISQTPANAGNVPSETYAIPLLVNYDDAADGRDMAYSEIWESVESDCETEEEIALMELLISDGRFSQKEKPWLNCRFMMSDRNEWYQCSLLWKRSKTMLFIGDNAEFYDSACLSDWNCFSMQDALFSVDELVAALKEK